MNTEAEQDQQQLRATKRHFGYESEEEPVEDALQKKGTPFFNVHVDTAVYSIDERFQILGG